MSTYKLSPLEELRLEKKRQKEERSIASRRLSYQLQYLNDNWGSMLTKGLTSSVKTKFAETMDTFSSGNSYSVTPFVTHKRNPFVQLAISNLPLLGSVAWKLTKPAIIAFALKQGTSFLFGRRKKKIR